MIFQLETEAAGVQAGLMQMRSILMDNFISYKGDIYPVQALMFGENP